MWSIKEIITNKAIKILLQPIISVKKKSILGYEVLSRGINASGEIIPAFELFESAKKEDCFLELDNLCRIKALELYKDTLSDKFLFLNFEILDLNKGLEGKNRLIESLKILSDKIKKLELKNDRIVIEIVESNVKNLEDLKFFTDLCKSLGFLVALDDVGSGHSNLNRIPLLKPDIIKIDRYLIQDIDKDYHKQEVFKSITGLSRVIGTLIVAEGVETQKEAILSIELRADFIQGFYFSEPKQVFCQDIEEKINDLYAEFKKYFQEKTLRKKSKNRILLKIIKDLSRELELIFYNEGISKDANIKNKIKEYLKNYDYIECIYLIDEEGKQISNTYFDENTPVFHKNSLFFPAQKGDDHSLKQYFYQLKISHSSHYISKTYISMATGKICRTVSAYMNKSIIIAMDIDSKKFNKIHF